MVQSTSAADTSSVRQEYPRLLGNPKVHHHVHDSPPLFPILSQLNPIHTFTPYFFDVHFNIILTPKHEHARLTDKFNSNSIIVYECSNNSRTFTETMQPVHLVIIFTISTIT
jgi:hypothetical protein